MGWLQQPQKIACKDTGLGEQIFKIPNLHFFINLLESNMTPKLYMTYPSAPARAVLITAKAIGLKLDLVKIDLVAKEHESPEYLKKNPQHTVPTLQESDGFTCWDSHAINAYLVNKYAKDDSLYPKDPRKRVVVDQRLHFDSGVLFTKLASISSLILWKGHKTIDQENIDGVHQAYEFLDIFLEGQKWIAGDFKSIADYSIFTSVTTVNALVPVDSRKYPKLTAWLKQVESLPESQENVKGLEEYTQIFNGLLGA